MKQFYSASLRYFLSDMKNTALDDNGKKIVGQLVDSASRYDTKKAEFFVENMPYFVGKQEFARDTRFPVHVSPDEKIGYRWADDELHPLMSGEEWNCGRRATFSGFFYHENKKTGKPVNPYMKTGVKGRGNYGLYSVNPTVSNGLVALKENKLHVMGIIRKDNKLPALSGGFIDDFPAKLISREERDLHIFKAQTSEMFEEMFSGAITLLPAYETIAANRADVEIEMLKRKRPSGRVGVREEQKIVLQMQTRTKLKQFQETSFGIMKKINGMFAAAPIIYRGPIMASSRNTDEAWAETHLSYVELTPQKWHDITNGEVALTKFQAGDDAHDVFQSEITPELVTNTSGSNGVYMAYCLASYLCNTPDLSLETRNSLLNQCGSLIGAFEKAEPDFIADAKKLSLKKPDLLLLRP